MQTISLILHRRKMRRPQLARIPREDPAPPFWTWFIENPPPSSPDEASKPKTDDPDRL
jgi:hypothetical protein